MILCHQIFINYSNLLLTEMTGSMMYVPDSRLVQDDDELEPTGRSASMAGADQLGHDENPTPVQTSHVVITTTKVSFLKGEKKEFLKNSVK
jgi:hypothetical protein